MSGDLQTSRYDQLIRRIGGIIGPGSKVTEALSELFPVIELENTTPELMALSGWRMCWQSTERPPLAANTSASLLFNPAGSGKIAVVTQIYARSDVGNTTLQAQIVNAQIGGTPVPGLYRDARFGVPRSSTCTVESADGVATGGGIRFVTGNELHIFNDVNGMGVLTPGTGLQVGSVNVNLLLTINYFWRERQAEESELSFPS